jgi:hypothetical protein
MYSVALQITQRMSECWIDPQPLLDASLLQASQMKQQHTLLLDPHHMMHQRIEGSNSIASQRGIGSTADVAAASDCCEFPWLPTSLLSPLLLSSPLREAALQG